MSVQDVSTLGLPDLALCGKTGTGRSTAINWLRLDLNVNALLCCCEQRYWRLKADGFVFVRLSLPESTRILRVAALDPVIQDLPDATAHLKADYEIENDGSKFDLYDELLNIILKERKHR